jgi:hypothetical protein
MARDDLLSVSAIPPACATRLAKHLNLCSLQAIRRSLDRDDPSAQRPSGEEPGDMPIARTSPQRDVAVVS